MLANSTHMNPNIKSLAACTRAVDNYQFHSVLPTVTELILGHSSTHVACPVRRTCAWVVRLGLSMLIRPEGWMMKFPAYFRSRKIMAEGR